MEHAGESGVQLCWYEMEAYGDQAAISLQVCGRAKYEQPTKNHIELLMC